jgi:hypothetical protein
MCWLNDTVSGSFTAFVLLFSACSVGAADTVDSIAFDIAFFSHEEKKESRNIQDEE